MAGACACLLGHVTTGPLARTDGNTPYLDTSKHIMVTYINIAKVKLHQGIQGYYRGGIQELNPHLPSIVGANLIILTTNFKIMCCRSFS